jgi:hypothetical protein
METGELVKGNMTIAPGTAIATFDADGRYGNHTDGVPTPLFIWGRMRRVYRCWISG